MSPKLLVSCSIDNKINLYDIEDNKHIKSLTTDQPLNALAFHPNGRNIAVGTLYGQIYIYDLRNGGSLQTILHGHDKNNQINFLDFIKNAD